MLFWPPGKISAYEGQLEHENYYKLVDPNYEKLPEVTLSAFAETGIEESSIPVLEQRSYTGRKPVISSSLADTPCIDMGVVELLEQLNTVLGTSYPLDPLILHPLLDSYVTQQYDFGTVFGFLRPYWYDITTMNEKLHAREKKDQERRKNGFDRYGSFPENTAEAKRPPRRLWDLYANRVLPWWVTYEGWVAISHAWMDEADRQNIETRINGCEWPVPMPKSVDLNHIRIEMLNIGAEYVWLDVLCLRQAGGRGEHLRAEEWSVDVPTIGLIYDYRTPVVCYFNGLGRPLKFQPGYFESDRCWFNRAWTLQETTGYMIIGGETDDATMEAEVQKRFDELLEMLKQMRRDESLADILSVMRKRVSTNPMDRVAGLAYLLDSCSLPVYHMMQSEEEAWEALTDVMSYNYRAKLFFSYPMPGNGKKYWRPSWEDVMTKTPLLIHKHHFGEVRRPRAGETDDDRYYGKFIHSAHLRGLASTSQEGVPRQGELKVFAKFGHSVGCDFKVIANHRYPIPDGLYTLIGNGNDFPPENAMLHWVAGKMQDGKFRKCSVFSMADDEERRQLLEFYRMWVKPGMRPDVQPAYAGAVLDVETLLC